MQGVGQGFKCTTSFIEKQMGSNCEMDTRLIWGVLGGSRLHAMWRVRVTTCVG